MICKIFFKIGFRVKHTNHFLFSLPLEGKVAPKATNEVLLRYKFADKHLISQLR